MHLFDTIALGQAVEIANTREMRNGSLVVHARAARGGNVQDYLGVEVDRPDLATVRVYRDADEIFRKDSLKTFGHKAVTIDHPASPVTAKTWKAVAAGHVGEDVLRDGEFVKIPMLLADQAAIDAVRGDKRELSVGYTCELDWTAGTTPDGQPYDARQTNILVDHVAIVQRGRAGPSCRIGDDGSVVPLRSSPSPAPQPQRDTVPMKTHLVDGHPVEMSDAAIIAVSALQKQLGTLTADHQKLTSDHATTLAAKDADLAKKDAEIDALKGKVLDAKALDAAVAARGDLIAKAKAIAPAVVTDGKTDVEIRHAVVAAKIGDAAMAGKTPAYIDARFDILVEDAKPGDVVAGAVRNGLHANDAATAAPDKAHTAMVDHLTHAWMGTKKDAA